MPRVQSESYGVGSHAWMGSTHGTYNARTAKLSADNFNAGEHYPDGFIRSGQPVTAGSDGALAPYTGSGLFEGFVLDDARIEDGETVNVALFDHGRVNVDRLPVSFTVPAAQDDTTTVVYVNASERAGGDTGGDE